MSYVPMKNPVLKTSRVIIVKLGWMYPSFMSLVEDYRTTVTNGSGENREMEASSRQELALYRESGLSVCSS